MVIIRIACHDRAGKDGLSVHKIRYLLVGYAYEYIGALGAVLRGLDDNIRVLFSRIAARVRRYGGDFVLSGCAVIRRRVADADIDLAAVILGLEHVRNAALVDAETDECIYVFGPGEFRRLLVGYRDIVLAVLVSRVVDRQSMRARVVKNSAFSRFSVIQYLRVVPDKSGVFVGKFLEVNILRDVGRDSLAEFKIEARIRISAVKREDRVAGCQRKTCQHSRDDDE
jgi:hypothetical protein